MLLAGTVVPPRIAAAVAVAVAAVAHWTVCWQDSRLKQTQMVVDLDI